MRIFYICPDFSPPSGGVKRLYSHVQILRDNGYDAYIVHSKNGFRPAWFNSSLPTLYFSDNPTFYPTTDTMVIPEGFPNIMKQLKAFPNKIIIALSSHYIFKNMPLGENWNDYGINWIMTNSSTTKKLIEWSMEIPNIHMIGTSIDQNIFYYAPEEKRLQVSYMARKDMISSITEKIVRSRYNRALQVEFIRIENLNIRDYAAVLRQSHIYLTTSAFEGFPRSIIEAMACGCVCIGSDGLGGRDFIIPSGANQNFIRVEAMDFINLSKRLCDLIEQIKARDSLVEKIRGNAIATTCQFTLEAEKESVLKFWRTYIEIASLCSQ